jgi:hypothetical protein
VRTALGFWVTSAAIGLLAGTAGAQIESHFLPPEMAPLMVPSYVSTRPPLESQEVSAPLLRPGANAAKGTAAPGADGQPDATSLNDMCKEPREAIRLAQAGKYKEAVEAGRPLLALPREKYRDYTWDYLANAVAWSAIQLGDPKTAAYAHTQAAIRIDDPAVNEYHRIVLEMFEQTKKPAADLKDYATYQGEVRKRLVDRQEVVKQIAASAQKDRFAETLVRHLRDAYEKLRVLVATDPETGRKEPLAAFRKAAQGLTTQAIAPAVNEAQRMQARLDEVASHGFGGHGIEKTDWPNWNAEVTNLWAKVRDIKRLCRIHDYLVRVNLADPGDSLKYCQQAHACLFVPKNTNLVWQITGQKRLINGMDQIDIRLRIPWQETRITPWGVPFSGQLAAPPGARPMDADMQPMQRMNGSMKPMDGGMQPMDDQPRPMTGPMKPMKPFK